MGLTEQQEKRLKELHDRLLNPEAKPLTEKMENELAELINKKENPELPQTAKTFCLGWIKQQPEFFGRRIQFSSKYTDKGLQVENDALDFAAGELGYGMLIKNTERFENDFLTGEPDNIQPDHTLDIKAPWTFATFPTFETEADAAYWWQGQGYMALTGKSRHRVIYCLMNTPPNVINREVKNQAYRLGLDEDQELDLYDSLFDEMNYDDLPNDRRLKVFEFEKDTAALEEVHQRVKYCREFIFLTLKNYEDKKN